MNFDNNIISLGKPIHFSSLTFWKSSHTLPYETLFRLVNYNYGTEACLAWFHHSITMTLLYSASWVKVHGTKYQNPFPLIIDKCDADDDDDLVFGEVTDIIVADKCSIIFEFLS